MLRESIVSIHNPLVKRFRAVREGRESGLLFIEGVRLSQEAISAGLRIESVIQTAQIGRSIEAKRLRSALDHYSCRGAIVSDKIMKHVCDTVSPQGIALIARPPRWELDDLFRRAPLLLLLIDGIKDPGNLGTLIRSAEAAGASGIALTPGTVSPANTKVVRASMGSLFRLPVAELRDLSMLSLKIKEERIAAYAASANGQTDYLSLDYTKPCVLLIGNETRGLSAECRQIARQLVRIPMCDQVDSLNAAVAGSVILFEAARQRRAFGARPASSPAPTRTIRS